jgi:hypothetical protein
MFCLDDGAVLVGNDPPPTVLMRPQPTEEKPIKTLVGSQAPIYKAFPVDSQAGSAASQTQNHNTRWLLYLSLAGLLVLLVCGVTALVLFAFRGSSAPTTETNRNLESQVVPKPTDAPSPQTLPSPSPSPFTDKDLVGAWRTRVNEQGQRMDITVTFQQDGATRYVFENAAGQTVTDHASWRYADGILYERYSNGKSGKDSIRWLDRDNFVLTIIDNGMPAYSGLKRRYHRLT